jgi:hypothetical protein
LRTGVCFATARLRAGAALDLATFFFAPAGFFAAVFFFTAGVFFALVLEAAIAFLPVLSTLRISLKVKLSSPGGH